MGNPPHLYEDLISDLIYLRKDKGFIPNRLRNASTVMRALGGSNQDFQDLRVRFVSAINSLPHKQDIQTLLIAYALFDDCPATSLSERRKAYGEQIGLKTDAIAKHENAAIRELAIQLLTARYTMSPLPFSSHVVPHNAALHEYVQVDTFVENKLWKKTNEIYKVISLVNNVGWLEISSDIEAIVASTCEAKAKTDPSSHGLRHRFYFDEPLMRGQATTLSFTMVPDEKLADPESLVLIETTRAFHEPTLQAHFTVSFTGQTPQKLWQYDHLAIYERPGKPKKPQLLELGKDDTLHADFTDLYGGMYSGVAWEW